MPLCRKIFKQLTTPKTLKSKATEMAEWCIRKPLHSYLFSTLFEIRSRYWFHLLRFFFCFLQLFQTSAKNTTFKYATNTTISPSRHCLSKSSGLLCARYSLCCRQNVRKQPTNLELILKVDKFSGLPITSYVIELAHVWTF